MRDFGFSIPRFGGTDAWSFRKEPIEKNVARFDGTFNYYIRVPEAFTLRPAANRFASFPQEANN